MTLVYIGLGWIAGIWLASTGDGFPAGAWGAGLLMSGGAAILARRRARLFLFLVCVSALCGGGLRFQLARPVIDEHHVAYYNDGDPVTVTGRVVGEPELRGTTTNFTVASETLQSLDGTVRPVSGKILLTTNQYTQVEYGRAVTVTGRLETPEAYGDFDYAAYLARRDIYSVAYWPTISDTGPGGTFSIYGTILSLKTRAKNTINRLIPEPEAALLTGILLGDDNGIPSDLNEDFKITGMTHIIAISGFNIMLIAGVLVTIGEWPFGRRGAVWFALVGVLFYTVFVGGEPSVLRAAIMGVLYLLATRYIGRPVFGVATLFLAAIVMTLFRPDLLWEVGFQLSFMATLGLLLYTGRFETWTRKVLGNHFSHATANRLVCLLSEVILITIAAQILVLPLIIAHFETISLVNLFANALVLPAQPAIMVWGGLATLVGLVAEPLAIPLGWVAYLFLHYTVEMVRLLAKLPFASMPLEMPEYAIVAIYGLIFGLTFWTRQRKETRNNLLQRFQVSRITLLTGAGMVVILVWLWGYSQPDGYLHVTFLDVGQGDAIFIQTPAGRQLLVDGGLNPHALQAQLGSQMPFWDRTLDMVVATHPDEDHVAGLPGVFERYTVDLLITDGSSADESELFAVLLAAATEQGTTIMTGRAGGTIDLGDGVSLEFVHPGEILDPDNRNENSVATRVIFGDFALLLTGDAEVEGERIMVNSGLPLAAQVFKAGHHGSRTSTNEFFLEAVKPQIVVVSVGRDNGYGHPHPEVFDRVAAAGAVLLRTDELGTIELFTDGRQIWWHAENPTNH